MQSSVVDRAWDSPGSAAGPLAPLDDCAVERSEKESAIGTVACVDDGGVGIEPINNVVGAVLLLLVGFASAFDLLPDDSKSISGFIPDFVS